MEEQKREPARLVSNAKVTDVFVQICGDMPAKLLRYQLKTKYGLDFSPDQPPCSVQTLHKALSETLGEALATSITGRLYPETRRAASMEKISDTP